jgi:hypothetical protein
MKLLLVITAQLNSAINFLWSVWTNNMPNMLLFLHCRLHNAVMINGIFDYNCYMTQLHYTRFNLMF